MMLLARFRRNVHVVTRAGHAVVLHLRHGLTDEARALAEALPEDAGHDVIVVDLPPDEPFDLPGGARPVRLVPGRAPFRFDPRVAQRVADRSGREVLAPHGVVRQVTGGALFVSAGPRTGWVRCRPDRTPEWAGKRFPRPSWDVPEIADTVAAGKNAVAEPVPAGVLIRPATAGHDRLVDAVPWREDTLTIVVMGAPDLGDVAAFWRTLPTDVQASVRFAASGTPGQALADLVDSEVQCYTSFPDVVFAYRPHTRPRLCAHRPPLPGLREIEPGCYAYTPDVVIEVVEAGLWVRSPGKRAVPPEPGNDLLLYDEGLRDVAERVAGRLGRPARLVRVAKEAMTLPLLSRLLETRAMPTVARARLEGAVDDR